MVGMSYMIVMCRVTDLKGLPVCPALTLIQVLVHQVVSASSLPMPMVPAAL